MGMSRARRVAVAGYFGAGNFGDELLLRILLQHLPDEDPGVGGGHHPTVLGDDGQAYDLLKELGRLPVDTRHILQDPQRMTPTYTKPMRRNTDGVWVELNRLDLRNRAPLAADFRVLGEFRAGAE